MEWMYISQVVLWVIVIFQCIAVLALARQIGVLHDRLGPGAARILNAGPTIGEPVPQWLGVRDIHGREVELGSQKDKATLLLFISTGCTLCSALIPKVKRLARAEHHDLEVIVVSFGASIESAQKFIADNSLTDSAIAFILSDDLALTYRVSIAPYALVIDRAGVLRSKGLVNSFADVESLLNASELDIRSVQAFHQKQEVSNATG